MGNLGTIIDGWAGEVNEQALKALKTDAEKGDAVTRRKEEMPPYWTGVLKVCRSKNKKIGRTAAPRRDSAFLKIDFY